MEKLFELMQQDALRSRILTCVASVTLQPCYLAAGFVRNVVWDDLHNRTTPTPLNDVDVIYFDPSEVNSSHQQSIEAYLNNKMPDINWQVRNQALMHIRNGHQPYTDIIEAMSYWPEKETAIAVRQNGCQLECISAFGIDTLLAGQVSHNPKVPLALFWQRVRSKNWLNQWPKLVLVPNHCDPDTFFTQRQR
ncbi:nucleotidyltransferase family protein [Vibrio methylphosphonaticus]|uniref:nucleotidyltransferase family protein n=1 Tax=Vibrio methylphosphonaticus TaxID=2946866 RepID=UPI002029F111|nr:nucleotidyltransferase family protein [Vibrio methylphosphonaticus]MCL9774931.1 nucleotidyltransferase family protein [Vibrio methylphosphonaticus]